MVAYIARQAHQKLNIVEVGDFNTNDINRFSMMLNNAHSLKPGAHVAYTHPNLHIAN